MSAIRSIVALTALALVGQTAAQANPTQAVAVVTQQAAKKGAPPKIIYYKNSDSIVTKSVTVKTPIYGPLLDKKGHVIGTKIIGYTSTVTKSTNITPKDELLTTNGSATTLSSPIVNFKFLAPLPAVYQSQLSGTQSAYFTLDAFSSTAPISAGNAYIQNFDSGTVSFIRTTPLQFYSPTGHTIGGLKKNLLTIVFKNATLSGFGGASVFSFNGSTPGSTISFSSDFVNFSSAVDYDFSFALNAASVPLTIAAVNPTLTNVTGLRGFNSTRANVVAEMGASAVPEPAQWSMLIAGFMMVGLVSRRSLRRRKGAVIA